MKAANKKPLVWLGYVSYPVTSAAYFERALRRICHCVTLGPTLPEEYRELWMLQNLKIPIKPQNIQTPREPDIGMLYAGTPVEQRPDLFLFVESVGIFKPQGLEGLACPKACYLIDNHVSLAGHLELARRYDYVFIAQRAYLDQFRAINPNSYWLPLGCDPEVHYGYPASKRYDVAFAGGVLAGSRRCNLLNLLADNLNLGYERLFWDEMAWLFSSAKIILNNAYKDDLNMRYFEALSVGSLMLADMARGSGQDELFVAGEEYALYTDDSILDVARYYLEHDELRETMARKGQKIVHAAHTYAHRAADLLSVALMGKADTWSARELRLRSEGVELPTRIAALNSDVIQMGAYRLPARIRAIAHYPKDSYPIFQYFNEQAAEFARVLGADLTIQDLRLPNPAFGSHEYSLVFVTMVSQLRPYRENPQVIAIVNDVWPYEFDEFEAFARKLPLVYVTNLEVCRRLQQRGMQQVRYLPFSIPEAHVPQQPPEKDVDIIQYGRQNPVLTAYMEQLLMRHGNLHYLTTEVDPVTMKIHFVSNKYGRFGRSDDRHSFMQMLSRCKVSLVSSPGYDGERDFDGCHTVAIRYFESAAQFCHLISRHPAGEEFELLGVDSLVHRVDEYAAFETVVLECLNTPFSTEQETAYRTFLALNATQQRALTLVNDLDRLNGLRRY